MARLTEDLWPTHSRAKRSSLWKLIMLGLLVFGLCTHLPLLHGLFGCTPKASISVIPSHASETLAKCRGLHAVPTPPPDARRRASSDRYEKGTKPYLIRNATIWTGRVNGLEILNGDVLLDKGLIKAVGKTDRAKLESLEDIVVYDAHGAWVSPGIVDLHSHMGDSSSPILSGASDSNSFKGPIMPWLRAVDGLNTHDDSYKLSAAGGITTALILPGSANAIGGEAYAIKNRKTNARTPTSMLVEPPINLNGSNADASAPLRWRHMKHACGENPARSYGDTRMDTLWKLRQAYDKARQLKGAQDDYCSAALSGNWNGLGTFPEDIQWEAMVAILRGQVKTHCYEETDITNFVRVTNEFKFSVAAFHHAHEAYLVPEVLRQAYGPTPAIAMFAAFSRYKREAYRHSHHAPRILSDEGIDVVMKSDHPAIDRTLLHEAQQAHFYGLADNIALTSVITTPAKVMGLDWRIGYIQDGYDADVVVWDSHPLALGATPVEVWIDGIPQFKSGLVAQKPASSQIAPKTPNFDKEAADAIEYEGLPPIAPQKVKVDLVVFINVANVWTHSLGRVMRTFISSEASGIVAVRDGKLVCADAGSACAEYRASPDALTIDLEGGALGPGIVSAGSALGLQEIALEDSTTDGFVLDPLLGSVPKILGGNYALIKAVDGLQFATRDALLAYRNGVTLSITAPRSMGFISGISTALSLGAASKLDDGAVLQNLVALHVSISMDMPYSVSTQIAALRHLLLHPEVSQLISKGMTLVIEVNSADIMATLIVLKGEIEAHYGSKLNMAFVGGTEAHLLASELAEAGVGVLVTPARSFPHTWEHRRILPGPPITSESLVTKLIRHNVTVGLGAQGLPQSFMQNWAVQNLRWDAAWAMLESNGTITKDVALELVSTNVEKLLGLSIDGEERDMVATRGGDLLSFESKVVAIVSPRRRAVDIL